MSSFSEMIAQFRIKRDERGAELAKAMRGELLAGEPPVEIPSSEIPSSEIPSSEIPSSEIPSSEIPSSEIPSSEIPSLEIIKGETSVPPLSEDEGSSPEDGEQVVVRKRRGRPRSK